MQTLVPVENENPQQPDAISAAAADNDDDSQQQDQQEDPGKQQQQQEVPSQQQQENPVSVSLSVLCGVIFLLLHWRAS